ncbi:MAG: ABC transporter ATP-binding protein [Candidatus Rokuibacteriota bacterium]|nr:MAG: ABC transporter ATP-binding protein [Candidatus Rokubacteria bacterium]
MLKIRGLAVRHGEIEALHDVSLDVGEGEIVAVIGPNGAGKTSLLRTVAGALRPARGSITIDGRPIAGAPAWRVVRHGIVLVPEGRRIFGDQTVRANLELGAVSHGRFDDMPRVLARFPALRERLEQPAGALSGGQQQMLAIARGLMARPRLLLLDEPSLGLAPRLVRETFDEVRRIRAEGVSVLLVEQLAALALGVADRGYVLDRGRVVAAGAARDLAADPRVVAAYLGRRVV